MFPFISRRRLYLCAFVLSFNLLMPQLSEAENFTVYTGTYTGEESKGIYAFELDTETGEAGEVRLVAETPSPSFLALHPNGDFLYAVNETGEFNGQDGGGVSAFLIQNDRTLKPLNQRPTKGAHPCHLVIDEFGKTVIIANYSGGSVISYQLQSNGQLGNLGSYVQHNGSSVDQSRQTSAHAHGAYLDTEENFVLVPDLGLDQVLIYHFDSATGKLRPADQPFAAVTPGSGPRHLAIHPTGNFIFVLNELSSTVTSFAYDGDTGTMRKLGTVPTLPETQKPGYSTAEIFVHPNGRFVYSSNRGHNSIAIFSVDDSTGKLSPIGHQPTGGKTPRSFNIDPTGKWLLAANQNSGSISVFEIDPSSGELNPTEQQIQVPSPVCLIFAEGK